MCMQEREREREIGGGGSESVLCCGVCVCVYSYVWMCTLKEADEQLQNSKTNKLKKDGQNALLN